MGERANAPNITSREIRNKILDECLKCFKLLSNIFSRKNPTSSIMVFKRIEHFRSNMLDYVGLVCEDLYFLLLLSTATSVIVFKTSALNWSYIFHGLQNAGKWSPAHDCTNKLFWAMLASGLFLRFEFQEQPTRRVSQTA